MMARLQYILREWVQNTFIFTLLVGSSALTPNFYVRGWNFDLPRKFLMDNEPYSSFGVQSKTVQWIWSSEGTCAPLMPEGHGSSLVAVEVIHFLH